MLSKNKIKYIHSLELKKNRKEEHAFVAEGHKLVGDLLGHFPCKLLVATRAWLERNPGMKADEIIEVTQEELTRASLQKAPQEVLAVFEQPTYEMDASVVSQKLCLALDDVQDPGNLGTIIRLADWFGIEHIFCSQGTVDVYNPKTIRSTMGSIYRMPTIYIEDTVKLLELFKEKGIKSYAAHLDGKNSYDKEDYRTGTAILIGNEGNGLRDEVSNKADIWVRIPMEGQVESLNAAIAASVLMFEVARQRRQ